MTAGTEMFKFLTVVAANDSDTLLFKLCRLKIQAFKEKSFIDCFDKLLFTLVRYFHCLKHGTYGLHERLSLHTRESYLKF